MSNISRDYDKIASIYNESGSKAAMEYIQVNYGIKYPRCVLTRIKKSSKYSYDDISKKFIINAAKSGEPIFMGIDELCKLEAPEEVVVSKTQEYSIDNLLQELIQEKLLELSKYVKLSRYSNTIDIDKTALIADGYQVAIH